MHYMVSVVFGYVIVIDDKKKGNDDMTRVCSQTSSFVMHSSGVPTCGQIFTASILKGWVFYTVAWLTPVFSLSTIGIAN